jgi:hypothetical protein
MGTIVAAGADDLPRIGDRRPPRRFALARKG